MLCNVFKNEFNRFHLMLLVPFLSFLPLLLAVPARDPHKTKMRLYATNNTLWKSRIIPVCWENPSARYTEDQKLVEQSIRETWGQNSELKFSCWTKCTESPFYAVRLQIADDWPRAMQLGNRLEGVRSGVYLNFDFGLHGFQYCLANATARRNCITDIAVHEFGHVIGFAHEQNRFDNPDPRCREMSQGPDGDYMVTSYDIESIMNYCKPMWKRTGSLSKLDKQGLQQLYGPSQWPKSSGTGSGSGTASKWSKGGTGTALVETEDWEGVWNCRVDGEPALIELRQQSKDGRLIGRIQYNGRPGNDGGAWSTFNEKIQVTPERVLPSLVPEIDGDYFKIGMSRSGLKARRLPRLAPRGRYLKDGPLMQMGLHGIVFSYGNRENWSMFVHRNRKHLASGIASADGSKYGFLCQKRPVQVEVCQSKPSPHVQAKPVQIVQEIWLGNWLCHVDGEQVKLHMTTANTTRSAIIATIDNGSKLTSPNMKSVNNNENLASSGQQLKLRSTKTSTDIEWDLFLHRQNTKLASGLTVVNGVQYGVACKRT